MGEKNTRLHSNSLQQGHCETLVADTSQQLVRIAEVQTQPHHARDGRERDVPLLEIRVHSELARDGVLRHPAIAPDEGGGVRTAVRTRESEARDQRAVREAGEEVLLLVGRAVPSEELPGPERVGNRHGGVGVEALRRELGEDLAHRVGAEPQSAPLLRDFHPEELLIAHVIPCLLREVLLGHDVVIVEERTQVRDLIVQEGFFLGGHFGRVGIDEMFEGWRAAEDVAIESYGNSVFIRLIDS